VGGIFSAGECDWTLLSRVNKSDRARSRPLLRFFSIAIGFLPAAARKKIPVWRMEKVSPLIRQPKQEDFTHTNNDSPPPRPTMSCHLSDLLEDMQRTPTTRAPFELLVLLEQILRLSEEPDERADEEPADPVTEPADRAEEEPDDPVVEAAHWLAGTCGM